MDSAESCFDPSDAHDVVSKDLTLFETGDVSKDLTLFETGDANDVAKCFEGVDATDCSFALP